MEDRAGGPCRRGGTHLTVCHFPPGTSKWNKIEHRVFSAITMNWRGAISQSEVIVDLISATKTRTGLTMQAKLDRGTYPRGIKVSDAELAAVDLRPHAFHRERNYDIRPKVAPSVEGSANVITEQALTVRRISFQVEVARVPMNCRATNRN